MALTEAMETQLAELDADQLRSLLAGLAADNADVAQQLATRLQALQSPPLPATRAALPAPDGAEIRREARAVMREARRGGYYDDYGSAASVLAELQDFLTTAEEYTEAGQGRDALAVLEAVTVELLKGWGEIQDYDEGTESSDFFGELGRLWTEAILTSELAAGERKSWAKRLREWGSELDDYDDGDGFAAAALAAEQGWDYPPLVRVLQGEITPKGAWEEDAPRGADALAGARLSLLERQGRLPEYLYLAEAEGQTERHLTMLVRLGRVQEAVAVGRATITAADQALAVAKALFDHGDREEALTVAELGLKLEPASGVPRGGTAPAAADNSLTEEREPDPEAGDLVRRPRGRVAAAPAPWQMSFSAATMQQLELARWLRDTATALGQPARALPAARHVLETRPSLADYQALQAVAGDEWPVIRTELLERLRKSQSYYREAEIDIFLAEGLIDDAIAALERGHLGHELVERVADAALATRPEWVMQAAFHQADRIIEPGKSEYYFSAAAWMRKAKQAAIAAGQEQVWRARMDEIRAEHGRKHKLMALLKPLA